MIHRMKRRLINHERSVEIEHEGLTFRVEFDYEPEEPQTRHYPGADAAIVINTVWVRLSEEALDLLEPKFEEVCWEKMNEEFEAHAEAQARSYEEDLEWRRDNDLP